MVFRRVGRGWRMSRETHRLRLYSTAEITRDLRKVEFEVKTLAGYGRVQFPPGVVGFVARKTATARID
jgi:hypothetical protein